ncbi:hypothetical protein BTJ49_06580 [Oleiagrimonas sp. MCCC 1A03011]|nr:hypothetical protein BTJ49_06580 [Oleiagrimonas sp. MCCC 1A03011]
MAAKQAVAALPCSTCQDIYDSCIAAGNTPTYCEQTQPAGCYGCGVFFNNTTQKMQKPDEASRKSALLGLVGKEFLQVGKMI